MFWNFDLTDGNVDQVERAGRRAGQGQQIQRRSQRKKKEGPFRRARRWDLQQAGEWGEGAL